MAKTTLASRMQKTLAQMGWRAGIKCEEDRTWTAYSSPDEDFCVSVTVTETPDPNTDTSLGPQCHH